jgi:hypothetical protein
LIQVPASEGVSTAPLPELDDDEDEGSEEESGHAPGHAPGGGPDETLPVVRKMSDRSDMIEEVRNTLDGWMCVRGCV